METVVTHLTTEFSAMMHIKAQQKRSRLREYCIERDLKGDNYAYDGLGQVEARELTGRFNLTQFDDLENWRRQISKRQFSVTLPIDRNDTEGLLTDPQGEYAAACVRALERAYDRVVNDSLFATVLTGRTFATPVTFAADNGLTVNATGGLTLAKLLQIKQNFLDNEVNVDEDVQVIFGITGEEHTTLLQIDQLVSRFYTDQLKLENGRIRTAVGMDIVIFGQNAVTPVLPVSSGTRTCFAFAKGGVAIGLARGWTIHIDRRPDYVEVDQVQITGVLGGVRTEGKLVQQVPTTV